VLRATTLGNPTAALNVPAPGQRNRWVFALPEPGGLVYAGITDEPVDGPVPDVPAAPAADIAFLLSALSRALSTPLRPDDVVGSYAGLRPLLDSGGGDTADISRRHALFTSPTGLSRSWAASSPRTDGWRRTRSTRGPPAQAERRPVPDETAPTGRCCGPCRVGSGETRRRD
jgi:hypothetical protein